MEDIKTNFLSRSLGSEQLPSLKTCAENLPFILQRPETFRFIIGILPEIPQEMLHPLRVFPSMETSKLLPQRPNQYCAEFHGSEMLQEVKQESVDIEECFHYIHKVDSELHESWSLGGVEDLFMESDLCRPESGEMFEFIGVPEEEEKPSVHTLLPWYRFNHQSINELLPFVDEKPSYLQPSKAWFEQRKPPPMQNLADLQSQAANGAFLVRKASVLGNMIPNDASQALIANANIRDDNIQSTINIPLQEVKTEPQESLFISFTSVCGQRTLVKRVCRKRNTARRAARWLSDKRAFAAWRSIIQVPIKHKKTKKNEVPNYPQSRKGKPWKAKICKISKIKPVIMATQNLPKARSQRQTNFMLALPAIFSEEDKLYHGKEYCQRKRKHYQSFPERECCEKGKAVKHHNFAKITKSVSEREFCEKGEEKSKARVMLRVVPLLEETQTAISNYSGGEHLDDDEKVREKSRFTTDHDKGLVILQNHHNFANATISPPEKEFCLKREELNHHNATNVSKPNPGDACDTHDENECILSERKRMFILQKSKERVMFRIAPSLEDIQTVLPIYNGGDLLDDDGKARENPRFMSDHDNGLPIYRQNFLSRNQLKGSDMLIGGGSYLEGEIDDAVMVPYPRRVITDVSSELKIKDDNVQNFGLSCSTCEERISIVKDREKSLLVVYHEVCEENALQLEMRKQYPDCPKETLKHATQSEIWSSHGGKDGCESPVEMTQASLSSQPPSGSTPHGLEIPNIYKEMPNNTSQRGPSHLGAQTEYGKRRFNGFDMGKMRGSSGENGDVIDSVIKEQRNLCHRSDGKKWQCTRECKPGYYYCAHHLLARRIMRKKVQ